MKKGLLIVRVTALFAALCMLIIAVAFSWFNNAKRSVVEEVDSNVVDIMTNGSQISYVQGAEGWFDAIDIPNASSTVFKPLSGDGESFFKQGEKLVPIEGSAYSVAVPDGYEAITAENSKDYITLDYKIRNNYDSKLYLDKTSYVNPASLTEDGTVASLADYCAGAIRLCISQKIGDEYVKKAVWIPNTTYQITYSESEGYLANMNGEAESSYVFRSNVTEEGNFTLYPTADGTAEGEKLPAGVREVDGVVYIWGSLNDIPALSITPIGTCKANTEEYFRLTIWLEGSDRECDNAVIGGAIKAMLSFNTVFKATE